MYHFYHDCIRILLIYTSLLRGLQNPSQPWYNYYIHPFSLVIRGLLLINPSALPRGLLTAKTLESGVYKCSTSCSNGLYHTHARTHTHTHARTHACTQVYTCTYTHACIHTHILILNTPVYKIILTYFQIKLHIVKSILKGHFPIGSVPKAGGNC